MLDKMNYLHSLICIMYDRMCDKHKDDWLTVKEVCKFLNISERKVRSLQRGGRIGYVRYGRKCCYKAEDVYALLMKGGDVQ